MSRMRDIGDDLEMGVHLAVMIITRFALALVLVFTIPILIPMYLLARVTSKVFGTKLK